MSLKSLFGVERTTKIRILLYIQGYTGPETLWMAALLEGSRELNKVCQHCQFFFLLEETKSWQSTVPHLHWFARAAIINTKVLVALTTEICFFIVLEIRNPRSSSQ